MQMMHFDQNLEARSPRMVNMLWQTGSVTTCLDITKENFYVKDTGNIIFIVTHLQTIMFTYSVTLKVAYFQSPKKALGISLPSFLNS